MKGIYTATEDELSEIVADRLIDETDGLLHVEVRLGRKGFGYLKKKVPDLVKLAPNMPVFLLTDLDQLGCAPELIHGWLGLLNQPKELIFRVAVREIEAWLLADTNAFSDFASVPTNKIPSEPEALPDPKHTLLSLIKRYSKRELRDDIVHSHQGGIKQGLAYNVRLGEFVRNYWSPAKASERSASLNRARVRISELADQGL